MPKSKQRKRAAEARARETQLSQAEAERKKLTPEQHMRRRAFGWALVALAVVVGVSHWLAHLGVLYQGHLGLDDRLSDGGRAWGRRRNHAVEVALRRGDRASGQNAESP